MEAEKKLYVFTSFIECNPTVVGVFLASSREDVLKYILGTIRSYAQRLAGAEKNDNPDGMYYIFDDIDMSDTAKKGLEYFRYVSGAGREAWEQAYVGHKHEYDDYVSLGLLVRGDESMLDTLIKESWKSDRGESKLSLSEESTTVI
jgi:hypothetical protein